MDVTVEGPVVEWRGPAPYFFVRVPTEDSEDIKAAAKGLEYWGQVPVAARIDEVDFRTALFWKDGCYLVPLRAAVRRAVGIVDVGEVVRIDLAVGRG